MPKTIFFDVGNTLLFPNRARILAPLQSKGVIPSPEQLAALERRTKKEFDHMLEANGHADHSFWYIFYTHLLEELGVQILLGWEMLYLFKIFPIKLRPR